LPQVEVLSGQGNLWLTGTAILVRALIRRRTFTSIQTNVFGQIGKFFDLYPCYKEIREYFEFVDKSGA
jgi:hypothetical protein